MAPSAGLEPTAIRLTVERSTIELKGQVGGRTGLEPALLRSQRRILPIYDRPHGGTMGI